MGRRHPARPSTAVLAALAALPFGCAEPLQIRTADAPDGTLETPAEEWRTVNFAVTNEEGQPRGDVFVWFYFGGGPARGCDLSPDAASLGPAGLVAVRVRPPVPGEYQLIAESTRFVSYTTVEAAARQESVYGRCLNVDECSAPEMCVELPTLTRPGSICSVVDCVRDDECPGGVQLPGLCAAIFSVGNVCLEECESPGRESCLAGTRCAEVVDSTGTSRSACLPTDHC